VRLRKAQTEGVLRRTKEPTWSEAKQARIAGGRIRFALCCRGGRSSGSALCNLGFDPTLGGCQNRVDHLARDVGASLHESGEVAGVKVIKQNADWDSGTAKADGSAHADRILPERVLKFRSHS